jgi:hypothetical protein
VRYARRIVVSAAAIAVAAAGGVADAQTQFQAATQNQAQPQTFQPQPQTRTQTQTQNQTQGGDPTNARVFMPYPDGDPRSPQRFRKPKFGNPPGFGAGTTGFDSTNVRANRKIRSAPLPPPQLPPLAPKDQTVAPIYREPLVVARPVALPPAPPPPVNQNRLPPPAPPLYLNSVQQRPVLVRRGPIDEDPFGPLGIRTGAFTWKPAVEILGGYDSNVPRAQGPDVKGSPTFVVVPELQGKSDWSRHELQLDMRGSYTWYTDSAVDNFNKPMMDLKAKSRIDISSQTKADIENRFNLAADSPGNPNNPGDIAKPPIYMTYGTTAGITQRFNRLEVTLKGIVDRTKYQDAELNDGSTLDLSDRDYRSLGWAARAGYEVSPGIKPFVEYGADSRKHDQQLNCFCENRDSDGRTIKGGLQFELTRKLTGEFSAGVLTREYQDSNLENLRGTLIDASLIYYATPLTTVKFDAKTTVAESSIQGVSGTLTRDLTLQVDHSFRRWLIGTLKFGYGNDDYIGLGRDDKRYFASVGATYKLTRTLALKGEFRQDWLRSNVDGADYTASTVLVGLRLQR